MRRLPLVLPCNPCPHRAACCAVGTTLTEQEARALDADVVELLTEAEVQARFTGAPHRAAWATKVRNGRCVLWNNGCAVYRTDAYPSACAMFPEQDPDDADLPLAADAALCPEMSAVRREQ